MAEKRNTIKVLHCMYAEKFIQPYIDFISDNFNLKNHYFLIRKNNNYPIRKMKNILMLKNGESKFDRIKIYYKLFDKSEKIILHGILSKEMWLVLFFRPSILKKCYWVIWGGDLYSFLTRSKTLRSYIFEKIIKSVISKIGFFLTYMKGDYDLAKKRYGASGILIDCLMYPTVLYNPTQIYKTQKKSINILVGNSAFPTNNHEEIFKKLMPFTNKNIAIFCPLSYGPEEHKKIIANLGRKIFGVNFFPLTNFMSYKEYLKFLDSIDIAIFAHDRQQGLGNTIALLAKGKKIYMKNNVSQWQLFNSLKIKIFDLNKINLNPINQKTKDKNILLTKKSFSLSKLKSQWGNIFEDNVI